MGTEKKNIDKSCVRGLSVCQAEPSQTSQAYHGWPSGQNVPAQPISARCVCKGYGGNKKRGPFTVYHACAQNNSRERLPGESYGEKQIETITAFQALPAKSQSGRCRPRPAWIGSVRPAQIITVCLVFFYRLRSFDAK